MTYFLLYGYTITEIDESIFALCKRDVFLYNIEKQDNISIDEMIEMLNRVILSINYNLATA